MEELCLIDAFIGQVFYVCETKKRYVYTTDELWTELCYVDEPNFIRIDKEVTDAILNSTTIDPVKQVDILHDELGLSYDQIRRIVLEKTSKS